MAAYENYDDRVIGSPPSGGGSLSQYFPQHQQIPTGVMLPTFGPGPTVASTAASTAGATAAGAATGASSMWGSLISQALPAVASLLGAKSSGQARLNRAQAATLEQLLAEYKRKAPLRQGLDVSFLGRLPDYMRQNFPNSVQPNPVMKDGLAGLIQRANNTPRFPTY